MSRNPNRDFRVPDSRLENFGFCMVRAEKRKKAGAFWNVVLGKGFFLSAARLDAEPSRSMRKKFEP
jgi:hypothetical protein